MVNYNPNKGGKPTTLVTTTLVCTCPQTKPGTKTRKLPVWIRSCEEPVPEIGVNGSMP